MPDHLVGVIGFPIDHSLSPVMHNAAYAALGLMDWRYEKIPVPPDVLRHSLKELQQHDVIGINVTIPHKRAVMPFVKSDAIALAVGAVNTIDFRTNVGTNSDVAGFMDDLTAHGVEPRGMNAVVLGAGGAARAAVYGLTQIGAKVTVVNRTEENAVLMVNQMQVDAKIGDFSDVAAADLIVNSTSVGMHPNVDESPLPDDAVLKPGVVLYEMVYRPAVTRLMRLVTVSGGTAIGGLGMLARQGAVGFKLWTGVDAPVDVMLAAAQAELDKRDNPT